MENSTSSSSKTYLCLIQGKVYAIASTQDKKTITVHAGSTATDKSNNSCPKSAINKRSQLIKDGILQKELLGNCYHFYDDYEFSSYSQAAQVITGQSISGKKAWQEILITPELFTRITLDQMRDYLKKFNESF